MFGLVKDRVSLLQFLFVIVFFLSSILRMGLALVNREAFDNHIEVINFILQNDKLPLKEDCPECFQPKVFYYSVATAVRLAGVNPSHQNSIIILAQLMNFIAGEIVLVFAYLLIRDLHCHDRGIGLIAFSLLAFNPALIEANGMASNDAFAIFFSSAAIYACFKFLQKGGFGYLLLSSLLVSLGIAVKTNVWATALAIFLTLLLKGLSNRRFVEVSTSIAFLLGSVVLVFLNPLSQYIINIQNYKIPVTLSLSPAPFPSFFEKTYVRRPGIISIQDGLFTVKFIDLLAYPRLTLGPTDYPPYRTSLWANLYGSANSVHFLNSPDSWHTTPDFAVTRSIFILALLPTAFFLIGAVGGLIALLRGIIGNVGVLLEKRFYGLFDMLFLAYFLFEVLYALLYRDFSFMKSIFIYPAILAFVVLFLEGADRFKNFVSRQSGLVMVLCNTVFVSLVFGYSVDIVQIIAHLYKLNFS